MEIDLLERCRARDREAFHALVSFWGDAALRTAFLVAGDAALAQRALRDALVRIWSELPSFHSHRPFRPWLMRSIIDAAEAPDRPDQRQDPDAHRALLDQLDARSRAVVILSGYLGLAPAEIALATGTSLLRGIRASRAAAKLVAAATDRDRLRAWMQDEVRGVEVPPWFYAEEVAPRLDDGMEIEVRRLVKADAADAWRELSDATRLPSWIAARDARVRGGGLLQPGSRIVASGSIAERRSSRDESVVTRAEPPRLLAWTTASRIALLPAPIEFRWSIEVTPHPDGCELHHRLHGVAFPPGIIGRLLARLYAKPATGMQSSMHRGIERLASLIETHAR